MVNLGVIATKIYKVNNFCITICKKAVLGAAFLILTVVDLSHNMMAVGNLWVCCIQV